MKCECGYETLLTCCPHCNTELEKNLHPDKKTITYFGSVLIEGTDEYNKYQNGDL